MLCASGSGGDGRGGGDLGRLPDIAGPVGRARADGTPSVKKRSVPSNS